MPQFIQNGQGLDIAIPPGQSIAVATVSGTFSATIVSGTDAGTVLATNSDGGGTYGPYASGATVRLTAGLASCVSYDVGASPSANANPVAKFTLDPTTGSVVGLVGPDGGMLPVFAAKTPILQGASAGANSGWLPIGSNPERFLYQLDSGSVATTFSVDISADGASSLGQALTGTWASSTLAEITYPVMFSNPQAKFFRWNVVSGGPLSAYRGA